MPRKPRFYLPDVPAHVVQRGNARQAVFYDESDYSSYLEWLVEGAERCGCAVHAYVLMTNHVHLLLTPEDARAIGRTLQHVGRKYVTYVNHGYGRSGTLWEGRHKGSLIDSEAYALACSRYIEMNPVRTGMVKTPGEYRWSSYRRNAFGEGADWLRPPGEYLRLGSDAEARQRAYRDLFGVEAKADELQAIRSCVQTGTPLGNDRFREQIERMLGRKVGQSRRGRPRKVLDDVGAA